MTGVLTGVAGTAYAAGLWLIAAEVGRRRGLALGAFPVAIVVLCGLGMMLVTNFVSGSLALLAGSTLIGAVVCAVVDARTGFIFDALSVTMLAVAAVGASVGGVLTQNAVAAALVGGALAALHLGTRRRGIGLGDVKLGAVVALGYGVEAALVSIGSAFVLGAVYALGLIACGRAGRGDTIAFGPFIAGGAAVGLTARIAGWLP